MKFDKTRVYSACNADEVKVGSKGYFADSISELKRKISEGDEPLTLVKICGEEAATRFTTLSASVYLLFYLVEEPKEKKYQPYYNTDEIPGCVLLKTVSNIDGTRFIITAADDKRVYLGPQGWVDLYDLYEYYTWPDGTPCGKEEQENEKD